jgi:flagellar protein FliJ
VTWAKSLIKISTYEVEILQKRMAEVVDRRAAAEIKQAVLEAEGLAEAEAARKDAENGWYQVGFLDGLRVRKAAAQAEIDRLLLEEAGVRDALAEAFEAQKKYEHVVETARRAEVKEAARRETAALDELGLRRAAAAGR